MDDFKDQFKYRAVAITLKKLRHLKSKSVVNWRKKARKYLKDFEYQYRYRNLPSWAIDTEYFETLEREAQSLLL